MKRKLQVGHFAALKVKYKATQYEDSSPSTLLYFILRKADLNMPLNDFELDWLREHQLFSTIEHIPLVQIQILEEPERILSEITHLKSKYQALGVPSLSSPLVSILWKLDSEHHLTDAEIEWLQQQGFDITASMAQDMGRFAALKSEYKATNCQESLPYSPLYEILTKLDAKKRLTDADVKRLREYKLFETVAIFQQQEEARVAEFCQLKSKYQANQHQDSSLASPLYNILQALEADKPLSKLKMKWLKQQGLTETIAIAQDMDNKRQFAALKTKYKATQYEDSSPSCHLYKILVHLDNGKQLEESDMNWLKKRQFTATMAIAQEIAQEIARFSALKNKYKATQYKDSFRAGNLYQILVKLDTGDKLSKSEMNWLTKQGLKETVALAQKISNFAALKAKYKATNYQDWSPSSPLYQILIRIHRGKLLTDSEVHFLNEHNLFETNRLAREKCFISMKRKYYVSVFAYSSDSPLYAILQKLEKGERLERMDVAWLVENNLLREKIAMTYHTIEANFYEQEFKKSGNKWNLPNASSHWRKAKEPKRALELTDQLKWDTIKKNKLKSALLTTRGGAFRDLRWFNDAEECARQAMAYQPKSHHPYTLMGAICYERGQYSEGDYWFEEAIKRGANPRDMDAQIKQVIKNAKARERQEVVNYLLKKDPKRYAWAKSYLKSSSGKEKRAR